MSEFVNTRDEIGDQATVDGLVSHTLTELKENGASIIATYAIFKNPALQLVELPGVKQLRSQAINDCAALETVRLGGYGSTGTIYIDATAFDGCSGLKHLIIDRPTKATKSTASGFTGTPIYLGEGAVYVPSDLIASYKNDANWNSYLIVDKAKYPLSSFDSIEDSWSEIFANADYATDYPVKSTKTLELTDGTKIKMDIAALNTDVKSDDSGTAKMTWICHGVPYKKQMHNTSATAEGWITKDIYTFLQGTLEKIPQEIKSHIVSVKKTYRTKSPNDETLSSNEQIWLPSYKELGFTSATSGESNGVTYSGLFNSSATRIKYDTAGSACAWWLRSAYDATHFWSIGASGTGAYNYTSNTNLGIVFGFCTD